MDLTGVEPEILYAQSALLQERRACPLRDNEMYLNFEIMKELKNSNSERSTCRARQSNNDAFHVDVLLLFTRNAVAGAFLIAAARRRLMWTGCPIA
jgi:hypothetical protein